METRSATLLDRALPFLIFGVTALVFLPVIHWLLRQTVAHEQLLHAFLVFVLTVALLVFERRIPVRPVCQFSATVQNLLILAYALLVAAIFTRLSLVVLAALCLSLAALGLFLFGSEQRRIVFASIGALAFFTGLAVLLPVMDWPLRTIAGQLSAQGLQLLGQEVELGLLRGQSGPMLLLFSEGRPFHVAAECNGFGMLSSSLLMALIIVLYRRIPLLDKLASLAAAAFIALVFNTVRIVIIVLLAPVVGEGRYMLMHEIAGVATTYGGLAILYFLLVPRRAASDPAEHQ